MGIIKWLKNKKVSKKIINEDDYIKSTLVHISYATSNPTMYILFTFSNSYCSSAIDILNNITNKCVYIQSSDDIYI